MIKMKLALDTPKIQRKSNSEAQVVGKVTGQNQLFAQIRKTTHRSQGDSLTKSNRGCYSSRSRRRSLDSGRATRRSLAGELTLRDQKSSSPEQVPIRHSSRSSSTGIVDRIKSKRTLRLEIDRQIDLSTGVANIVVRLPADLTEGSLTITLIAWSSPRRRIRVEGACSDSYFMHDIPVSMDFELERPTASGSKDKLHIKLLPTTRARKLGGLLGSVYGKSLHTMDPRLEWLNRM
ncbi:hypothetical protein AAMO2058_001495400 [Amorphochlora amoebiformis]|mmetsp:Transcript_33292/g.53482  ORF Transcript_33292/g.53482 Transcript_33292/m.53482 type:complete len:234 (-) Transcript_33292:139-840(-)